MKRIIVIALIGVLGFAGYSYATFTALAGTGPSSAYQAGDLFGYQTVELIRTNFNDHETRILAAEVHAATESVTATNSITAAETGKTFFLNSATEFVSTLPAPAAGLKYRFIVVAAPSGASYTVVTTSSSNIVKGQQFVAADAAGDTGTTDDTISFVDGQSVAGDECDVISDGTSWFAKCRSAVAAGVTFTTAS
jgi:membrane protein implicated in regulation of membrane protease activity